MAKGVRINRHIGGGGEAPPLRVSLLARLEEAALARPVPATLRAVRLVQITGDLKKAEAEARYRYEEARLRETLDLRPRRKAKKAA